MRIAGGMPERGIEVVELRLGQGVFPALRLLMDFFERHARFIRQVSLPQPVRTDNVQCPALALRGEVQFRPA